MEFYLMCKMSEIILHNNIQDRITLLKVLLFRHISMSFIKKIIITIIGKINT